MNQINAVPSAARRRTYVRGSIGRNTNMYVNDVPLSNTMALFEDPPAKEECPICFLPMPVRLMCCVSLPPATITSVPVFDFACAHRDSVNEATEEYYECCGKSICKGCVYSFIRSGNNEKCPYCKAERKGKTNEEKIEELMKRVDVNDANAIYLLGSYYSHGQLGLQRSPERKKELWTQAAKLGSSQAHFT
jgi:hypothetical protein